MLSPCPACRSEETLQVSYSDVVDDEAVAAVDDGRSTAPSPWRPGQLYWERRCTRCGHHYSPTYATPRLTEPLVAALDTLDQERLASAADRTHGHLDPLGRVFALVERAPHRQGRQMPAPLRHGSWLLRAFEVAPQTPVRLGDTVLVVAQSALHPPGRVLDIGPDDRYREVLPIVVLQSADADPVPLAALSAATQSALGDALEGGLPVAVEVTSRLLAMW